VNLERVLRYSQIYNLLVRPKGAEPGTVFLSQRRVYILPTRQGLGFALVLLVILLGAINYSLSLGYLLVFLLASLGMVSILHTFRNLAHLYVSPGRVEPVFAGDNAHFDLYLENHGRHDRFSIVLKRGEATTQCDVPARDSARATLIVATDRRGALPLGRVTIETRFPLGLLRAWSYVIPDMDGLVYPKPDLSQLPVPAPEADSGDSVVLGAGADDFSGLRPYQAGDSSRHIAWKAVARGSLLLTKQFTGRAAAQLWLDWNALPRTMDIEARLSRLTRWVLLADTQGLAWGLRIPGVEIPIGQGAGHRAVCLCELALHKTESSAA
jgi:uncharacterized protein (DUF58 family)